MLTNVSRILGLLCVFTTLSARLVLAQAGGIPKQVDTLAAAVAVIQTQLITVQTLNTDLQKAVATLQAQSAVLQSTNTSLQNAVSTLQAQQVAQTATAASLQTKITALQTDVTAVQATVAAGPTTVVRVHSNFNNGISDPNNYAVVSCAPGERLTGGGAFSNGRPLLDSSPLRTSDPLAGIADGDTPTAWFASNTSPIPIDATVYAYAVCQRP